MREMIYSFYHPFLSHKVDMNGQVNLELDTFIKFGDPGLKRLATIDAYFMDYRGCSLALMRTCQMIWWEMRQMLREARYIMDLTNPKIYWTGEPGDERFELPYNCPKPKCLTIHMSTSKKTPSLMKSQQLRRSEFGATEYRSWRT